MFIVRTGGERFVILLSHNLSLRGSFGLRFCLVARTESLALWSSFHINQSKLPVWREQINLYIVHYMLIYIVHVPSCAFNIGVFAYTCMYLCHPHTRTLFLTPQIQEHRDAVELKIQTGVIASPIAKPQATSKSQPVASKLPPVLSSQKKKAAAKDDEGESPTKDEEEPPKSEVSGEGSSLSLSFDEPSKPVKKKPQLSSERRAAWKKEEGESPKKDEDAEESSSLSVSFDEPSKPVKKKPALSSQKKAAAQKKTEGEESGSPSATPESKPKQPVSRFSLWCA